MSFTSLSQELRTRPDATRTFALLKQIGGKYLSASQLISYHEHLLFYKAYPPSKSIRRFCEDELARMIERVNALDEYSHSLLDLSGIAGTKMTYAYEFPNAKWLIGKAGKHIEIDWDLIEENGNEGLENLLQIIMEASEGDAIDSPFVSMQDYLETASGKHSALPWLLKRLESTFSKQSLWPVYDALLLDLSCHLNPPAPSRTLVEDHPPKELYLWNPRAARQKINVAREVVKPLYIGPTVKPKRGRELLDLVHGSLLVRLREYYGATRANPDEFYDIPVGRGMRLLLWFMTPEYRLPLETGLGFLLVKNGVPIGYGGGGMHAMRIEIAINIFHTFRGGDAAWIYAQTARVCYAMCGSPWLIARKYQMGGDNNKEGLQSGSFWFYYKMGFRSIDPEIRGLAESERRKIQKIKGYRTPVSILKKLSKEDAVLSLRGEDPSAYREPSLGEIGMLVPKVIAERYGGDRTDLTRRVLKDLRKLIGATYSGWTKPEKERFAQMGLFMLAIPGIEKWSRRDLDKLIRLARLKGSIREGDYVKAMRHNLKFNEALEKLVIS
jgi:hypothetical protein